MKHYFPKYRRIAALLLSLALLLGCCIPARAEVSAEQLKTTAIGRTDRKAVQHADLSWPGAPGVSSDSAILIELNSGTILYSKAAHKKLYPASITKVMTTLLALENIDINDTLTLSHSSVTDLEEDGYDWRFSEGESFGMLDALYAFNLDSVNTLGHAIAEHLDGSVGAFAERMNAKARELGCLNTNFQNPHGLNTYWTEHQTTAYDMALILWAAIQYDLYRTIGGTPNYSFRDTKGKLFTSEHNYKLFDKENERYDSRAVCGKTGHTNAAGYTRVLYATDGKLDLICVTMHASSSDEAYTDVTALLNYGFNNFSLVEAPAYDPSDFSLALSDGHELEFAAGEGFTAGGAALCVPNTVAGSAWTAKLTVEDGTFLAGYCLEDEALVYYPLSASVKGGMPETTEAEQTERTEKKTEAKTETDPDLPTAVPSGEEQEDDGKLPVKAVIIMGVLGLLLCAAVVALLIRSYQVKELKRRNRRRRQMSSEEGQMPRDERRGR